jgi:hypothetical protein
MFAEESVYDFHRKARKGRKAGAPFGAGVMRRTWICICLYGVLNCGSLFSKQFIDAEIAAPKIK